MNRLQCIARHLAAGVEAPPQLQAQATSASMSEAAKSPEDVVICCAVRTAVTKAKKGGFKDSALEEMLAPLFKAVVEKTKVNPSKIEDITIGNVLSNGGAALTSRMGQFMGGVPFEAALSTVNRQCSSGLQAVASIAQSIKAGIIDIGIAGGVESMTQYSMTSAVDVGKLSPNIVDNDMASSCLIPMGITSENVAEKWNLSREVQDTMAVESHAKAIAAQKAGLFDEEIVPVTAKVKDAKGNVSEVVVKADDGPRAGTTLEGLGKLKAVFKAGGSTTAGNASQVSDGAALVLLASRAAAEKEGLPILARMRSFSVVGVDPNLMGIGPAFAIPTALEKAGLKTEDIDIYEINEAFASQATMSINHLGIPKDKLNPKGGAIALGHPLGCTGARQIATLLPELKRQGKKLGVVSMCIGSGMGAAGVIESEM